MKSTNRIVPHLNYQKFQEQFGSIPAGDKNDEHIIKSRMLQGLYRNKAVESCYCNYLEEGESILNFMGSERLKEDAVQELSEIKKRKRLTDESRLMTNLLSSQPLAFNIFLPLKWDDYRIATAVFRELFPGLEISSVDEIKLEYVPGDEEQPRRIDTDNSCFDVWIGYRNSRGERGGIGFEVKYTESFSNTDFRKEDHRRLRYVNAIDRYHKQFSQENASLYLSPKFNQLFRNQLLAETVKDHFDEIKQCALVVLYSAGDKKCVQAINEFGALLKQPETFIPLTIERLVDAVREFASGDLEPEELYAAIYNRYCNYELLESYLND